MTQSTTRSTPHPDAPAPPTPPPKERRRLREAMSMTVKQLAATVGVTQSTVKGWETGRSEPRGRKGEMYVKLLAVFATDVAAAESAEDAAEAAREAAERAERERQAVERQTAQLESVRLAAAAAASEARAATEAEPGAEPEAESEAVSGDASAAGETTAAEPGAGADAARAGAGTDATGGPARTAGDTDAKEPVAPHGALPDPVEAPHGAVDGSRQAPHGAVTGPLQAPRTALPDPVGAPPRRLVILTKASPRSATPCPYRTPEEAFDALYAYASPSLVRQAYLLTGHRRLARESVERAFQQAWMRWPEIAVDRDPAGWMRAAVHEYALSPWHRFRALSGTRAVRPTRLGPDAEPVPVPDGRALRQAVLALPPAYRRALLLYDGLGLDLPDAAAEVEASTPATAHRVLHAREAVSLRLPELADADLLHERLDALVRSVPAPPTSPARTVRLGGERRAVQWTRAAIVLTVLIVGATVFTVLTAPRRYNPPEAPAERVTGVPVPGGPGPLKPQDTKLRKALDAVPLNGPERLLPRPD
ncbi:helix-turn-helix domain-containing protein [Streptomyces sp. DW26H14]|uniref:helix-turn-helix domain-containing protein n=1 Tax=Streptomyces sp. DW26H14 TaxID=3435395 RepID=UPI00403DC322